MYVQISAIASLTGSGVSSELVIRAEVADNGATYKCTANSPALSEPVSVSFKLAVQCKCFFNVPSLSLQLNKAVE